MNYRIWFHPLVARDLDAIAHWILDYAGPDEAARKLGEIEAAIATLKTTPHKGSLRDEIAPGLRAIPAGRKSVIAFVVDDDQRDVLIYALMAVPIGPCAAARAADDSLGPMLPFVDTAKRCDATYETGRSSI